MTFTTIASGSSGNCYILEDQGRKLLVEAGIQFAQIQKALKFQVTTLDGCLISHAHLDHAKSWKELMKIGVRCYANMETWDKLDATGMWACILLERHESSIGAFKVLPFDVPHDIPTLGFLIEGPSGEKCFFCTDAGFIPVKPDGCQILCVEANFDLAIMKGNNINGARQARTYKGHNDISRLERWFDQMIEGGHLASVREIHLLHLSSTNADAFAFLERVQKKTGKLCFIAGAPRPERTY